MPPKKKLPKKSGGKALFFESLRYVFFAFYVICLGGVVWISRTLALPPQPSVRFVAAAEHALEPAPEAAPVVLPESLSQEVPTPENREPSALPLQEPEAVNRPTVEETPYAPQT